ncbi:coiled-coil domain-containing protein 24 [Rhinoraja longicauda]
MSLKCKDEDSLFTDNYEQPLSLWKLIEECVPPCERDEIRLILGESAVDLTLDLHGEVAMLLEIWRLIRTSRLTPAHPQVQQALLPESPAIKDLLRHEIQLLLLNIQNKAHKEGRNESDALSLYNPDIVSFALGHNKAANVLNTPVNAESMKDKWIVLQSSQTNSNCEIEGFSCLSHLKDNVEAIKDKFNVTNIDEIVAHLQSILQEESQMLEKYIQFLQESLEEEHYCCFNPQVHNPVPSIAELRKERKILERDLQLAPAPIQIQVHKPPGCRPTHRSCRKTARLNNPAVSPSGESHSSTATCGHSEPDLEQKMIRHNISPLGEYSAIGTRDSPTKLKYSGILAASSQRTSCKAVDLSIPTSHGKETSTGITSNCRTAGREVKTQGNIQPQKTDDMSRTLSANKIESACYRTSVEESPSLQEEGQVALVYSQSTNDFPTGQLSIASSTQIGIHRTTENNRTVLSSLKSPVEIFTSTPKHDGYVLNPTPPTTEKPIGTQGKSTNRLRRARIDNLTGHT